MGFVIWNMVKLGFRIADISDSVIVGIKMAYLHDKTPFGEKQID